MVTKPALQNQQFSQLYVAPEEIELSGAHVWNINKQFCIDRPNVQNRMVGS